MKPNYSFFKPIYFFELTVSELILVYLTNFQDSFQDKPIIKIIPYAYLAFRMSLFIIINKKLEQMDDSEK